MQRRPISATIFGILNIGFGAFSWIELLFFKQMATMTSKAPTTSDPAQMHWQWVAALVDAVAAAPLVSGGVGLLAGKNWGRVVSIAWGVFDVLFCLARFRLNWDSVRASALSFNLAPALVTPFTWMVTIVATLTSLIFPALLIFFMTRPKVKAAYQSVASPTAGA